MTLNMDSDDDAYGRGGGFLGDLVFPIRRYPYEGRQQFLNTWKMEVHRQHSNPTDCPTSEWMLFTGVDERTFTQDFLDPVNTWYKEASWTSYDASESLLLVKMPASLPHETAAAVISKLFWRALEPTGLTFAIREMRSAVIRGPSGSKQADVAWAPKRTPPGHSQNWPSVVVEVAFSETPSKLMSDVRFWFHQSEGDVKVVLTLKIDRRAPELTINKWELQNDRPHRTQQLTITKENNGHITVRDDPLIIQFANLFLRPPDIPRETDILIDAEELKLLATDVWEEQGWFERGSNLPS